MNKNKHTEEDWNTIDVEKIAQNNQNEITKLFEKTKSFFLWFFDGNEELFHDLIMDVIFQIKNYDASKGKFHNWVFHIALMKKRKDFQKNKKFKKNIPLEFLKNEIIEDLDFTIENEMWKDELKTEMLQRLKSLPTKDQAFVWQYFTTKETKPAKDRMRFFRLLNKLK